MKERPLDPEFCKVRVPTPGLRGFYYHQCTRKARLDGFCNQHHPATIAERERKREASRKPSVWELLAKAQDKIRSLEREIAKLKKRK